MCDIFPVFQHFCVCVNLRIGMMIIAVLAIVTGCIIMCVCEQRAPTSYKDITNVTTIRDPKDILSSMDLIVRSGISAMSALFMFAGIVLLIATLSDEDGLIQVFVWVTFANILFGLMLVLCISFNCLTDKSCILDGMDWLTASTAIVAATGYLISWIYFISVANSYIVQIFN